MRTAMILALVAAGEIRSQIFMTSDQRIPVKNVRDWSAVILKVCKMDAQPTDGKGPHSLW